MPPIAAWDAPTDAVVEPLGGGLINQTWSVTSGGSSWGVLQRLNTAIFKPEVHEDIEAVTSWLAARGAPTTRLVRTRAGRLWHTDPEGGVWRVLTPIGDRTVEKLAHLDDARAAGALVARFHGAMRGFAWGFRSVRPGAHDTDAHLNGLMKAVEAHRDHRLWWEVASLSETLGEGWRLWRGPGDLPVRVIHGDLKISNVRFQGAHAVALIDLDTLQWGTLDVELGDALRSWCNPAAEDAKETAFSLPLFEAAIAGYAEGAASDPPTADEWDAIVPGVERICWELSARFAKDALEERYFGWNPAFGTRGDHNLLRARGQAALAKSVRAQAAEARAIVARHRV